MSNNELGLFLLKCVKLPANSFNSFFYLNKSDLPSKYCHGTNDILPLKLLFGSNLEKVFFTSLGPSDVQVPQKHIGACASVIQRLGLKENDPIFVNVCSAKSLSLITVRPKSTDDYNIMVSIQTMMEQIMLNQVRIVAPGQPLVLQIGNIIIDLIVDTVKPQITHGRLERHTEVDVADLQTSQPQNTVAARENDAFAGFFRGITSCFFPSRKNQQEEIIEKSPKEILLDAFNKKNPTEEHYRVVFETVFHAENVIYICNGFETDSATPCRISVVLEKVNFSPKTEKSEKPQENEPFYCMVKSKEGDSNHSRQVYLSESFMKTRDLSVGSRLVIEPLDKLPEGVKLVTANIPFKRRQKHFMWASLLKIKREIMESVDCCVRTGIPGNTLVTGPPGCGKTYLMNEISKKCLEKNIYCCVLSCKTLRVKKVESLTKIFAKKWAECAYREPSVLILDDLDAFNSLVEEFDENGITATYGRRVSNMIVELAEWFGKISRTELIATSNSVTSLGSALASVRGPRLFSNIVKIPELVKDECREIFNHFGIDLSPELLEKTHGFRVQDLADLASRGKLRACVSGRKEADESDIRGAFEDTVPRALQGIQLKAEMPYTWSDVGGMEDVKITMDEIFRWPSKYPDVFASCPLRLQTGALLYGPPGCGKTLIAGALANECGMNFKSVKGPELLSKYIGASEAAVRELFDSANQAQPCLLFFDELDSLAPRRGADSTGVTDRVVNQLLTELDGVEGRSGVWVLGATSRPDLIDPALLRPGRLDRVIYCPVPTQESRLKILQVLSKNLKFSDNVDLADLASQTEDFTGADLQGLLYNCQMNAIKEQRRNNETDYLVVTSSHIEAALLESRSSLSANEKLKLDQIYMRFQSAKKRGNTEFEVGQGQKVTLA